MYELVVLGLLMLRPAHGYLVATVMNEFVGPFARASHGIIFPLLARLEKDGLATSQLDESDSMHEIREFTITDAGRIRFRALMADTRSRPRRYRELFLFKAAFLSLVERDESVRLVTHYLAFCRSHALNLESIRREAEESAEYRFLRAPIPLFDQALRQSIDRWNHEIAWARTLLPEDLVQPKAVPPGQGGVDTRSR